MKNLQTPSESKGKSGNFSTEIAGLDRPFIGPGINIEPSPSKSHDGLKLYSSHTKARVSVPTFILSFRISENLEGLMPKLCAIPVLVKPLSFKRVLMAVINRLFISVFPLFEYFGSENLKIILFVYRKSVSLQRVPIGICGQRY